MAALDRIVADDGGLRRVRDVGEAELAADRDDVAPVLVLPVLDERDELADLLVVERSTIRVAPRRHRDRGRRLRATPVDREIEERLRGCEQRGILADGRVF